MARPRTPAKILELRGAFKRNPDRKREDLEGIGSFDPSPPTNLQQELVPAWREIVSQINPVVLTGSDYLSIETMARLLWQYRLTSQSSVAAELRQWFAQYGLTAAGRAKLGAAPKKSGGNKFQDA